ncbi:MAG: Dipeptidase [Candidatus Tokpelaia hoelldobleri]|uniref:Dipeptidase n=1 Tax=Candidatus Tokpelaia hoelldobleri TaxID=1902579 RepID=A0A1U9JWE1_9HYPH|nr:MAG: Dipeptidase [Candidatus Tokpelaia hoelldoblerii]
MVANRTYKVFDGHNDMLLKLWQQSAADAPARFHQGGTQNQIDAVKARQGHLAGGLCAIFPPSPDETENADGSRPELDRKSALDSTLAMAALLARLEQASPSTFKICRTVADIDAAVSAGQFAAVFHIEGAEAIGKDLDALYILHQAGLRSIGPVWSRPNIFAFGVPFRFPSSPDIGPGLSETGKNLIRLCNRLRIMIDLSHMNEKGFWDVARLSDAPLVASHSNAHTLCPHSRNLTDKQLNAIGESGGLVGINFGVKFLRDDGQANTNTPLDTIVQQIKYIADRIGIDHVALGSDFDGTTVPADLSDTSKLPNLVATLASHGFDNVAIEKVCFGNWRSVLSKSWG